MDVGNNQLNASEMLAAVNRHFAQTPSEVILENLRRAESGILQGELEEFFRAELVNPIEYFTFTLQGDYRSTQHDKLGDLISSDYVKVMNGLDFAPYLGAEDYEYALAA